MKSRLRAIWTLGRGVAVGLPSAAEDDVPHELFATWLTAATDAGVHLPEAMAVASVSADGAPSCRMVLCKDHGPDGFVFFTNYESRKGTEIAANPRVSLLFHWPFLARQVRVQGVATRTSPEVSAAYHRTRERGRQIGAWASHQSRPLPSRAVFDDAVAATETQYQGKDVPLPPHWGGFQVTPLSIEFWQGRAFRLHDRLVFSRPDPAAPWSTARLYP